MNYDLNLPKVYTFMSSLNFSHPLLTPTPYSPFGPSKSLNVILFKCIFPRELYWSPFGPYNRTTWTKLELVTITSLQSLLNVFGVPS